MNYASAKLLAHPNPQEIKLSIRAKAVIFSDPKSRALLEHIERIAPTDAVVLINGETGTGKELIADPATTSMPRAVCRIRIPANSPWRLIPSGHVGFVLQKSWHLSATAYSKSARPGIWSDLTTSSR